MSKKRQKVQPSRPKKQNDPTKPMKEWFAWRADRGGCGYDRAMTPARAMNAVVPNWTASTSMTIGSELRTADIITGQRICREDNMGIWTRLLHPESKPAFVYEVDDNLFKVEPHNPAYEFFSDPELQERMAYCVWAADAVITSCDPLAQFLTKFNPHVYVIPNYLPRKLLTEPVEKTSNVVVGWAGGSSHYMDMVKNVPGIQSALEANPDVGFTIYGQNYKNLFSSEVAERTRFYGWQENKTTYMNRLKIDVGLCPLVVSEFNECKTAVKALEYAFKGIPTIASNVTPYKQFVEHGVSGLLVDTAQEWHDAIDLLINDHAYRNELGANAYAMAQGHVAEDHAMERAAIYEEIIDLRSTVRPPKAAEIWAAQEAYQAQHQKVLSL